MENIEKLVDQLPPDMQEEVRDFAQFLLKKKTQAKQKKLRLSWAGALREYRDQFTSLELQKKALDWFGS